jgi:hypothetical protein
LFIGILLLIKQDVFSSIPGEFSFDTCYIEASSGYLKLKWTDNNDTVYILQQSNSRNFEESLTIYRGPDQASFVSGLGNGDYYYRFRPVNGNWSETLHVRVEHQSLRLAFTLFFLGGFVFLLTAFVILHGVRKVNSEKE